MYLTEKKVTTNEILLEELNNYHRKIKLNIELNTKKFLDKLICVDGIYNTIVVNSIYNTTVSRKST